MNHQNEFKLVKGIFDLEDAQEILGHLFDHKIKFHQGRQFGMEERLGVSCEYSQKRLKELKDDKAALMELLQVAAATGKTVKVNGHIQIELVEETPTLKSGKVLEPSLM